MIITAERPQAGCNGVYQGRSGSGEEAVTAVMAEVHALPVDQLLAEASATIRSMRQRRRFGPDRRDLVRAAECLIRLLDEMDGEADMEIDDRMI